MLYTIKRAKVNDEAGNPYPATDLVYLTYEEDGCQLVYDDQELANQKRIALQQNDGEYYYKVFEARRSTY